MSDLNDEKISDKLVTLLVKEHKFKKRLIFANISLIMDKMVDDATVQMLVPTMKDLITVSLKNDETIVKLIDTLKKYDDKKLSKFGGDDEDDNYSTTDELLELIDMNSDEEKHLHENIKDENLEEKVDEIIDESPIKNEIEDE